jgi:hypothetical protein
MSGSGYTTNSSKAKSLKNLICIQHVIVLFEVVYLVFIIPIYSQEVLINCSAPYNDSVAGSSRSLNRTNGSPTSTDDPTFWVPHFTMQQQPHGDQQASSDESSQPQTPSSPTSSNRSVAGFSMASSSVAIPIARNDKHMVLTCSSPARPKVSSMQQKLDHTKIDTSLYQEQNSPTKTLSLSEDPRGQIHITLVYDPIAGILTVRLIEVSQPGCFAVLPFAEKPKVTQENIKRTPSSILHCDRITTQFTFISQKDFVIK